MALPSGAPMIMARLIPNASLATVDAAFSGGAVRTATTTAWAKKVDVTSAVISRAASRTA
jgi:hypothetical protein